MWNAVYAVRNLDLPPLDKWLLVALASYGKPDGTDCHPGMKRLSQDTGISERQVRYGLRKLEGLGLITSQDIAGGRGRFTSYDIHLTNGAGDAPIDPPERVQEMPPLEIKGAGDAPIVMPERGHSETLKGAQRDAKGGTARHILGAVPNEQVLEQDIEQEGVRASARPREGSIDQLTHTDALTREGAYEQAPAHEPSPLVNPSPLDDPKILEIYRGYWESFPEPFFRGRLFQPKSEWGFNKYLEAHGRNIWSVYPEPELVIWQPAYRHFCVHMARKMKAREEVPA